MKENILYAAKLITDGELVIFPTETVYGIGADATNNFACEKIYQFKNRPKNNPLIVHVSSIEQAHKIGIFNSDAKLITQKLWPGPLTIIVPLISNSFICKAATADLDTIALRYPANNIAQTLIQLSNVPIAAPSANISTQLSSTTYLQIKYFSKKKIYILNDGNSEYGVESTILDLSVKEPKILRYGLITPTLISSILNKGVNYATTSAQKSPGTSSLHYAPNLKLRINATKIQNNKELGLNFGNSALNTKFNLNLSKNASLLEAAHNLYRMLYLLDKYGQKNNYESIAVAPITNEGIGLAINDRLNRAQNGKNL